MSKFTIKIISDHDTILMSCDCLGIQGRQLALYASDSPQPMEYETVFVKDDENCYVENPAGKTVFSLPRYSKSEISNRIKCGTDL